MPFGTLIVREIAQGPPVKAPVEVRIYGRDPAKLQAAAEAALGAVRKAEGVSKVRSTLGSGMLALRLAVDDTAAGSYGIQRSAVSAVVLGNTLGIPGDHLPRGRGSLSGEASHRRGESSTPASLSRAYLGGTRTET